MKYKLEATSDDQSDERYIKMIVDIAEIYCFFWDFRQLLRRDEITAEEIKDGFWEELKERNLTYIMD